MSMLQTKNQTQTFKEENMSDLMFVYGTLVSNVMRQAVLNHPVEAQKDSLRNYVKTPHTYFDVYPTIKKEQGGTVEGVVFPINWQDKACLDRYETEHYKRIKVKLESGKVAFAYIEA